MKGVNIICSLAISCVLIYVGAKLAAWYNLPFFHTWALIHGTFFLLFPIYFFASYFTLRPLFRRVKPLGSG